MSFFDYLRRERNTVQSVDHPIWGTLTSDRPGWWDGECDFAPTGGKVQLIIHSSASGPREAQADVFLELSKRYQELLPKIGEALFELWQPWLNDVADEEAAVLPRSVVAMLQHTRLETIWIDTPTFGCSLVLSYGFARDGIWDDASMNVGLESWVPKGIGVDD